MISQKVAKTAIITERSQITDYQNWHKISINLYRPHLEEPPGKSHPQSLTENEWLLQRLKYK